ncbi:hypothetical protein BGU85_26960, partial [Clostridioides difficile]
DKFSKVKKKFGSGKFKVELYKEKSKLNREIDDIQEKKAKIFLEMRYESKGLRVLGALMFIIYQIGRMSIIMYLPSIVLAGLTG